MSSSRTHKPNLAGSANKFEVKIPVEILEIGMYVSNPDRPWTELPTLLQGLTLETTEDIKMFQSHCSHVFISTDDPRWIEAEKRAKETKSKPVSGFRETRDIHDEMPHAKLTLEETHAHIEKVLNDINNGEAFDAEESRAVVRECMKSIVSNANAILWLTKIKNEDKYTSEHCMRVGVLSIAFGRFLDLPEEDLELLGLAGMLHDVGKIKTPPEILNKPGKLTPEEYDIMKQHSVLGKDVLDEVKGLEELVVDTAHYHHERVDGNGYPEKLDAKLLHKFIRMVSVVDVYDAITSDRCYQQGRSAFEALKILFSETDKHFDKELVEIFIRMIGIYPPGTLVEMINGEVGIVISSNPNARLKPKVELVADAEKKIRPPYIVDLATNPKDAAGKSYVIKTGLPNKTYGIDIKDYLFRTQTQS
jgi:putative nucleotidyltransferase with HDIG domain